MANKKEPDTKAESKWYVDALLSGSKTFYTAAKQVNGGIVTRGGYWERKEDAEATAKRLNEEGK